jgi:uncharacterized membrane protein YeaQ/YmgE (transglycosylase-associated protein family)
MIGFIAAGLVIGLLARFLLPGRQRLGFLATVLLGLAGSIIGGTAANALGKGDVFELNTVGFIFAVVSAMILIALIQSIAGARR